MKVILTIAAIAAAVYFGAQWIDKNPQNVDMRRISPPVQQLPGPQDPYGK